MKLSDMNLSNPYVMLKFSIRSEATRKYYERRITRFFDFIEFSPDKGIEERFDVFATYARKDLTWGLNKIMAAVFRSGLLVFSGPLSSNPLHA